MKNELNISIKLIKEDTLKYELKSTLKKDVYFLPMIIDLPTLMEKIFSSMERGGRCLVEEGYIPREKMRQLLEESFDSAIKAVEPIIDRVR